MSARTKKLPATALSQRIMKLQTAVEQLKTAQFAGSTNVQLTRTVTGNNPDFVQTCTEATINIWEIIWTPADTTFANSGFIWHMFADATESGTGAADIFVDEQLPENNQQKYLMYFLGLTPATVTFNFVIVIYAIGSGTIDIAQIM